MQGHVRQRTSRNGSPGSWQVIVNAGRDPITGKRRTLSGSAPTKKAAMVLRNRLLAELGASSPLGTEATVAELFEEFMACAGPASPNSRYNYRLVFERHVGPRIGTLAARRLRGADLNRVYSGMRDTGLAPATIRKAHTVVSAMCTYGMKNEWLVVNPARNASPPHVPKSPVRATPPADIAALLRSLQDDPFGLCVLASASLGTRRGETLGLQWRDIDFELGQVTIARRVVVKPGGGLDVIDFTKTGGIRRVALDQTTLAALGNRLLEAQATVALAEGELAPDAFVFSSEVDGRRPWYPDSASRMMLKARRRLGLVDAHLHGIRHHAATTLIAAGVDARTVAERLGNSPDVVLRVYSHFVPAADRVASSILERSISLVDGEVARTGPGQPGG